jgi:hypothetical protein
MHMSDYKIGYGKPPAATQFKKGQSGNPKGRPPGRGRVPPGNATFADLIKSLASRKVDVNVAGETVSMMGGEALLHSLWGKAAAGDLRSQQLLTRLITQAEEKNPRHELLKAAIEYKTQWAADLEWQKRNGPSGPQPLPHPDHIKIDMATGEVEIVGPMTEEEKSAWGTLNRRRRQLDVKTATLWLKSRLPEARPEPEKKAKYELPYDLKEIYAHLEECARERRALIEPPAITIEHKPNEGTDDDP